MAQSQGESHQRIGPLTGVHVNTVTAYLQEYADLEMQTLGNPQPC